MFLQLAHYNTDVFKKSKELALACYKLTQSFPSEEKFALTQQIRRAALSVHFNISEGCSRKSETERKRFFEIARGSVIEIDTALEIAQELNYGSKEFFSQLAEPILDCFKQLSNLIRQVRVA
jgi:four helix bundle protein